MAAFGLEGKVRGNMLTWDQELVACDPYASYQIIRRNGAVVPFEPSKISIAMMQAFLAVRGTNRIVQAQLPVCDWLNACSTIQMLRRPNLVAVGGWIKQYLLSLFKLKDRSAGVWTTKQSGFFSAGKANLRNAP